MSETRHLLIAYAATDADGCTHALQTLRLPHLERLLAQLGRSAPEPGQDSDPTLPHERALAQALGLPSPATPWAVAGLSRSSDEARMPEALVPMARLSP